MLRLFGNREGDGGGGIGGDGDGGISGVGLSCDGEIGGRSVRV